MKNLNKKIKNSSQVNFNDLKFKSRLEFRCYTLLKEANLDFSYESEKIILWEGKKLENIIFYCPKKEGKGRYGKDLGINTRSLLNITYTPDFIIIKDNYKIYVDVKGKENDTYPIKKKMFLKLLDNRNDNFHYIFFEPHNIRQIKQCIDIINNL